VSDMLQMLAFFVFDIPWNGAMEFMSYNWPLQVARGFVFLG